MLTVTVYRVQPATDPEPMFALIDLIATVGYYSLVSLTLNAFEMPTPDESKAFD